MNPYTVNPFLMDVADQHQSHIRETIFTNQQNTKLRISLKSRIINRWQKIIKPLLQASDVSAVAPLSPTAQKYACASPEECADRYPLKINLSPTFNKLTRETINQLAKGAGGFVFLVNQPVCENCQAILA